jgi:signal transduction histidine kinase
VYGQFEELAARRTLELQLPENEIVITCDRQLIKRVMGNLISNALKFTGEETGEISISVKKSSGMVRVSVADNGYGISPEYLDKIFDKFAQVQIRKEHKRNSTGLGLTFCKLAVEAHGGEIGVSSELNKGSEFWFTLPLSAPGVSSNRNL